MIKLPWIIEANAKRRPWRCMMYLRSLMLNMHSILLSLTNYTCYPRFYFRSFNTDIFKRLMAVQNIYNCIVEVRKLLITIIYGIKLRPESR